MLSSQVCIMAVIIMASNVVQPIKINQIYSSNQAYNTGCLCQCCTRAGLAVFWHFNCRALNIQQSCIEAWLRSLSTSHMFICASCQYHMLRPSRTYVQHLQTFFFIFVLRDLYSFFLMLQPMCKMKVTEKWWEKCDRNVQMGCGFLVFHAQCLFNGTFKMWYNYL